MAASTDGIEEANGVTSLLAGAGERDFLVRNTGDQVKISSLDVSPIGLYFSASWCGPCQLFTPKLIGAYKELLSQGKSMEVVLVSADQNEEAFNKYFSKMPWLAIPFSDSETRDRLDQLFKVQGIPHLIFVDGKSGEVVTEDGVQYVSEYGAEAYPFTTERINKFKEEEEAAKRNQTLRSVLVSPDRDYVISNKGEKVPVSEIEGKFVGLYFCLKSYCREFTPVLARMYEKLKEMGESFEVVLVSLDQDETSFNESFQSMPWLALPFKDKSSEKLARYFELSGIPTLVMIGADGKTLSPNVAEIIEEHGVEAFEGFPFTKEKLEILAEKAKAKQEAQTLESLLISEKLDYVIGKDGAKVPVSDLVGKNILLYFSAKWCGPCRAFLPKLIEEYRKIKEKDTAFEIIFISSDRDQNSFDEFYSGMPWLALPLEDERKASLKRIFKIRGIPSLVAIGPMGRTVTKDARNLLMMHGADAYPFTEERIKELDAEIEQMARGWPEKVKHALHEAHELVLTRCQKYGCDGCKEIGFKWSYHCTECNFDLHPKCALKEKQKKENDTADTEDGQAGNLGCVCDGEVCRSV